MEIKMTRDYTLFQILPGNRGEKKPHIRRLQEAISANAEMAKHNPILVNEKYEIIDGQHRFWALKELGLPIYYTIAPKAGLKEVQELNSVSKIWSPADYARSYRDIGRSVYQFYLDMKETFKLNHDVLTQYVSLSEPMTGEMFKDGKLVAPDRDLSWELASALTEAGQYCPDYNLRAFAFAFKSAYLTQGYDHQRMLAKMKRLGKDIPRRRTEAEYLVELEKVYNHYAPLGTKFRFAYN